MSWILSLEIQKYRVLSIEKKTVQNWRTLLRILQLFRQGNRACNRLIGWNSVILLLTHIKDSILQRERKKWTKNPAESVVNSVNWTLLHIQNP